RPLRRESPRRSRAGRRPESPGDRDRRPRSAALRLRRPARARHREDHEHRAWRSEPVHLLPGNELDLGTIALDVAPSVRARAIDGLGGQPVAAAEVRLREVESGAISPAGADTAPGNQARTDENGRVALDADRTGAHLLEVRHPDYLTASVPIAVPPT